ncbi:MAG TPA: hypothetical protein VHN98_07070, partial [Acidimicrobiales bacterium]|nr:hypothetical protein [Acidimicrobiales bacterium]
AVGDVPARTELRVSAGGDSQAFAVEVEGRPALWPGRQGDRPVIVAARDRLPAFLPTEMWVAAPMAGARPALVRAGLPVSLARTAAGVRSASDAVAVELTFGFVEALGALAGLIAVVGLVLYVEERQRVREISYALSRRMGLGRATHLFSVAVELGTMLAVATLTGCAVAWVAARAVMAGLDTQPSVPPRPALTVPHLLLPTLAGAMVALALAGSLLVQRRADAARLAEVLRRAG